jgi:hypothetical protein
MHNEPHDFFMLRRAAMPADTLTALHAHCGDDFQKWEAALLDLYQTEQFRQAVYIASPSLSAAMDAYDKQAPEKSRRKVLFPLYKYLIRMCTRATPFGLFSVTGTGLLAERSRLSGSAISNEKKTIRLQISALTHIASWLENRQLPGWQTCYVANSSLHLAQSRYRYIETKKSGDNFEQIISQVERFPELDLLIQAARAPQTKIELANRLGGNASPEQSARLVQDMIGSGLLVSKLSANATGPDFQDRLQAYLDECRPRSNEAQRLYALISGLSSRDSVSRLQETATEFTRIVPALAGRQLFRAELGTASKGMTLSKKALARLAADFAAVKGLLSAGQESSPLTILKQKFRAHYGPRPVPLCELLESEMGMAYAGLAMQAGRPPTLLDQLEFTRSEHIRAAGETATSRIKQGLFDRAISRHDYKVEILESDLGRVPRDQGFTGWARCLQVRQKTSTAANSSSI